jgi:hypothetical protein
MQIERGAGNRGRRQQLGDVADARCKPLAPRIADEMAVFLHECAATGAVDDDRLIAISERCDIDSREGTRRVRQSGVRMQRSAADLTGDLTDVVAVHGQGAHGRIVDMREEALLDAAPEQQRGTRKCERGTYFSVPRSAFHVPRWLRRRQHPKGEPDPAPSSDAARQHGSQQPGTPVDSPAHPRRR